MNKRYNIAVVGATGSVGMEVIKILQQRNFPVKNVYAIASNKSIGKKIEFLETSIYVDELERFDFTDIDIIFTCADSKVTSALFDMVKGKSKIIIDKSSLFRLNSSVPLIVPEVNIREMSKYENLGVVASPNCCVIPLVMTLKPLGAIGKIKKVVVSTYPVSYTHLTLPTN